MISLVTEHLFEHRQQLQLMSSGLRTSQGAVAYIVAKGYAASPLWKDCFKIRGTK